MFVHMIHFRDGDIVSRGQAIFQTFDCSTLVFQGHRPGDRQRQLQDADYHALLNQILACGLSVRSISLLLLEKLAKDLEKSRRL